MNYQKIFKRYEYKYLITQEIKNKLLFYMQEYMKPDKFGNNKKGGMNGDMPPGGKMPNDNMNGNMPPIN